MSDLPKRRAKPAHVPTFHKPLPCSIENEAAALSCLVQWPKETQAMMVSRGITREFFTVPRHQHIAVACFDLTAQGKAIDFVTLVTVLRDRNQIHETEGMTFFSELFHAIPSSHAAGQYLEAITNKHALRKVILEGSECVRRAFDEQDAPHEIIGDFVKASAELSQLGHRANKPTIAEVVMRVINERQRMAENPREVAGLSTFLPELDKRTGGLLKANTRLICAPPNTGKTVMLLNNLECVAIHHQMPALIIEMEMSREKLVRSMSANMADLDVDAIRDNRLDMEEEGRWAEQMKRIASAPITIEKGDYNRNEVVALMRAWKAHHPDGRYVAIDYLQLLKHKDRDNRTLADEISEDVRIISLVAQELDITVDLASQQTGETAKGSRGPEEHADMMLLIREDSILVKKSRSGGKGYEQPITIDADRQRIIPRDEDEAPRRRGKRKPADI